MGQEVCTECMGKGGLSGAGPRVQDLVALCYLKVRGYFKGNGGVLGLSKENGTFIFALLSILFRHGLIIVME